MSDKNMSIVQHLEELRRVLIISLLSLIPTTSLAWVFRNDILGFLVLPLRKDNPEFKLTFFGPTEAFFVFLKLSLAVGFILAMPIIFYQIWKFVLPALRQKEKKVFYLVVPLSVILFVGGIIFAYFTVLKVALLFFLGFGGEYADAQLRLNEYISFVVGFLLPFGLVFQLPVIILILTSVGIVTPKYLAQQRKYAFLIIIVVAAIATPPDVISQLLMGGPMYLLFEISIWISYLVGRRKTKIRKSSSD